MTKLIDADALLEAIKTFDEKYVLGKSDVYDQITNAPTVQREVTVFFEDDNKEVLCFEQYKPEHIVVVLDYAKGEYVQVLRPNEDGTTSSKMYEVAPVQREGWVSVPIEPTEEMLDAVLKGTTYADDNRQLMREAYKAMIQAAPTDKE
jgi:hypothetical protein